MAGDEVAVVAVHSVLVTSLLTAVELCDVVHVALRGPAELLGAVEARIVAPAVQVV